MTISKWNEVTKLSLMNFFLHLFFLSPVVVFFYQQRGLNFFQILALESVLVLFIFFFEVPTGLFADKFGRKKSVIFGSLLLTLEPIIFIFAKDFFWFAIAFALAGIGITFHSGAIEALIYDNLKKQNKEKQMKKAMGTFRSASLLAMVVAPVIGSYVAKDLFLPQFIFLLMLTIGFITIGFILSLFIKDTREKDIKKENPVTLLKEGIQLIKSNKSLLHIILLSMFSSPFIFVLNYLYQPYFKESGVNVALFGVIFALALLAAALLQKYAYKFEEKLGMKKAVLLTTIIPGILYVIMAFVFHPIWALLLFIMIRGTMGLSEPLFSHYKNIHISSRNRATILSLISMFVGIYLVIMRLVIGKLADYNVRYAFMFMGIIIILASIFLKIDERHLVIE